MTLPRCLEDHAGRLWIGVDSGVWVLDHGRFLPIRTKDGKSLGIVFGITEDAAKTTNGFSLTPPNWFE